jgi:hypothetical protein
MPRLTPLEAIALRDSLYRTIGNNEAEILRRARPLDQLGFDAMMLQLASSGFVSSTTATEAARHTLRGMATRVFDELRDAEIVLWEPEIWRAATRNAEAFAYLPINEIVPFARPQIWFLSTYQEPNITAPVVGKVSGEGNVAFVVCGLADKFGFTIADVQGNSDGVPTLRLGAPFSAFEEDRISPEICEIVAAMKFETERFVTVEHVSLPRPTRREYERREQHVPAVKTVVIRRTEPTHRAEMQGTREYHVQWLVNGFWRKLPEPRKSDGARVTYVQSHIRGPENAPFQASRPTILHARR